MHPITNSIFALIFTFWFAASEAQVISIPLKFELKEAATTSAGIYSSDSTLIRTLWSNIRYPAGMHTVLWDRKDDYGKISTDKTCFLKVLSNNIKYTWEGAFIGNTSDSMTGPGKHRYFSRPNSMAITGEYAYYTSGYAEGITSAYKFKLTNPQNKTAILNGEFNDVDQMGYFTASDGKYVYWAGIDPFNTPLSFVYATSVKADEEIVFQDGMSLSTKYGRTYKSAIDVITDNDSAHPSGMAVQSKGNFLFVAHQRLNQVHVFNKSSGRLVQKINLIAPRQLTVDRNDRLWIITESNSIKKYNVNTDGSIAFEGTSISGTIDPLALAVSPDDSLVLIANGGLSQQITAYANNDGRLKWTLGLPGGYANGPEVYNDKFFFSHEGTEIRGTFIAFQPDHSFWVGDPGNERIQHFASDRTFINSIMSLPHSYSVEADRNNPKRIFNEYLEFDIDYSKPLSSANGSWTLIRNWRYGVKKNYYIDFKTNIFRNIITLNNGRSYATLTDWTDASQPVAEIVELPPAGNIRYTGIRLKAFENFVIDPDGSLRTLEGDGNPGNTAIWYRQMLSGFDTDNNPIWSNRETDLISPRGEIMDPLCDGLSQPVKTSGGVYPVFNAWVTTANGKGSGFRLGGLSKGKKKWLWLTSKASSSEYMGPFPSDGTFDAGNGVQYPGGNVYAMDRHIFWNYHGEFWKNSQTNIWNHYYENGLMAGQFGISTPDGENISREAFPMGAGNVFSSVLVKVGEAFYLYHNDESVHAGIHRWKISNLSSVSEQTFEIKTDEIKTGGLTLWQFKGVDMNNTRLTFVGYVNQVHQIRQPEENGDTSGYSQIVSGYIKADSSGPVQFQVYSDKGLRLWFNDTLILNDWDQHTPKTLVSKSFNLIKGQYYQIKLETIGLKTELKWLKSGLPFNIPASSLIPIVTDSDNEWVNLLENLPFRDSLENARYGWFRTPAGNFRNKSGKLLTVRTNIKTIENEKRDLDIIFQDTAGTIRIRREIHQIAECNTKWALRGTVNLQNNTPDFGTQNFYIDIKDKDEKIICRITHDLLNIPGVNENNIRIRFNGNDVMNLPRKQMYQVSNYPVDFEIRTENATCDFVFFNQIPLRTLLFDSAADWKYPAYIDIQMSGSDRNQRKEINLSRLDLKAFFYPQLYNNGPDSLCSGQTLILKSRNAKYYLWNTGEKTQNKSITKSGSYQVATSEDQICWVQSEKKKIAIFRNPEPLIRKNGLLLVSNYSYGNQWFLNDTLIPGERFQQLSNLKDGLYKVMVTDSNACSGISESFSNMVSEMNPASLIDSIQIFPNPSNGSFILKYLPAACSDFSIIDVNGRTVYAMPCRKEYVQIPELSSGIYVVLLRCGNALYKQKIAIMQ